MVLPNITLDMTLKAVQDAARADITITSQALQAATSKTLTDDAVQQLDQRGSKGDEKIKWGLDIAGLVRLDLTQSLKIQRLQDFLQVSINNVNAAIQADRARDANGKLILLVTLVDSLQSVQCCFAPEDAESNTLARYATDQRVILLSAEKSNERLTGTLAHELLHQFEHETSVMKTLNEKFLQAALMEETDAEQAKKRLEAALDNVWLVLAPVMAKAYKSDCNDILSNTDSSLDEAKKAFGIFIEEIMPNIVSSFYGMDGREAERKIEDNLKVPKQSINKAVAACNKSSNHFWSTQAEKASSKELLVDLRKLQQFHEKFQQRLQKMQEGIGDIEILRNYIEKYNNSITSHIGRIAIPEKIVTAITLEPCINSINQLYSNLVEALQKAPKSAEDKSMFQRLQETVKELKPTTNPTREDAEKVLKFFEQVPTLAMHTLAQQEKHERSPTPPEERPPAKAARKDDKQFYEDDRIVSLLKQYNADIEVQLIAPEGCLPDVLQSGIQVGGGDALQISLEDFKNSQKAQIIIPLRVSTATKDFAQRDNNHFVGLYLKKDQSGAMTATYIDPMGQPMSAGIKDMLGDIKYLVLLQPNSAIQKYETEMRQGISLPKEGSNDYDCGPFLVYLMSVHAKGLVLPQFDLINIAKSKELGQTLRGDFDGEERDINKINEQIAEQTRSEVGRKLYGREDSEEELATHEKAIPKVLPEDVRELDSQGQQELANITNNLERAFTASDKANQNGMSAPEKKPHSTFTIRF